MQSSRPIRRTSRRSRAPPQDVRTSSLSSCDRVVLLGVGDLLRHVAHGGVRRGRRLPARGRGGLAAGVHGPIALVEVLRAERADVPLRADELRARRADALQARAAGRAEDEVVLHALAARRADETLLGFREERLLRELTLVGLAEGLLRADDEVDEQPEDPR